MNAVELLLLDHEKVRKLFREWGEAGDRQSEKRDVVEQALMELTVHSKLEQEIVYPAIKNASSELAEDVDEGYEEHRQVDMLVDELKAMGDWNSQVYIDRFQALVGAVEHHVAEEEGEMLPKAQQALGGQADALAQQMTQRREQLLRELLPSLGSRSTM